LPVELRHLRHFVGVAEELHFGRAAARLHLAQPALSQSIRALEAGLDIALFERTSRRVTLTPAGAVLLAHARRILMDADALVERAVWHGRRRETGLRLGFVGNGFGELTTAVLEAFAAAHPHVHVSLHHVELADQLHAVAAGRVDVAAVRLPADDARLTVLPVMQEPRVLAVAARHPLAQRAALSITECADEVFLPVSERTPARWRDFWLVRPRPDGSTVRVGSPFESLEEALQLVAAGRGVITAAASLAQSHARNDVAFVPLTDVEPSRAGLAWPRRDHHPLAPDLAAIAARVAARAREAAA
jgi:DNA-binding transcriptional LysR family regulator